jgi:hypothetical protein
MSHGAVSKRHGSGKVGLLGLDASMTSEILRIAVEDETVFTGMKIDGIIGERLRGIEAEKEDETGTLESQQLILLMLQN